MLPGAVLGSDEWLGAVADRLAPCRSPTGDDLVIEHIISDLDGDDLVFHIVVTAEGTTVVRGPAASPAVTFAHDHSTAAAIASGDLSARTAFMSGRMQVRGDLARLTEAARAFADPQRQGTGAGTT